LGFLQKFRLAKQFLAYFQVQRLAEDFGAFTEAAGWPGHDLPEFAQTERLQQSITPNVRALHAHWLAGLPESLLAEAGIEAVSQAMRALGFEPLS
jgi:hypothetical protein